MPIVQSGSINTTALAVPDAYISIVQPAAQAINGVPSNIGGVVGTAAWGPVNSPVVIGNIGQYQAIFGPLQPRKYDMGTVVADAGLIGANNFRCVRVTDGTDTAATAVVQSNCLTINSKYTGSGGAGALTLSAGSAAGTVRAVVSMPGYVSETYDNIGAVLSGNALWLAIGAAINNGNTAFRGPSKMVVAVVGSGTSAPTYATYTLTGGTDGVASVTGSTLVGTDGLGSSRTGMYALRSVGCAVTVLADCDASATYTTQAAYCISEATYGIGVTPAGDTISNAATTLATAGVDTSWFTLIVGDWVYWLDTYNNVTRLVNPQSHKMGILLNLAPNGSALNKEILGIAGTQSSYANQQYSGADLQLCGTSRLDLITNPCPGGSYFGFRFGRNTSSNPLTNGDNYTRMTNYLVTTLNAAMGKFVGELQDAASIGFAGTPSANAAATLRSFCSNLQANGLIGAVGGPPAYFIEIDADNNPEQQVALGYLNALAQIRYQSVIQYFVISVQGGQSVVIPTTTLAAAA